MGYTVEWWFTGDIIFIETSLTNKTDGVKNRKIDLYIAPNIPKEGGTVRNGLDHIIAAWRGYYKDGYDVKWSQDESIDFRIYCENDDMDEDEYSRDELCGFVVEYEPTKVEGNTMNTQVMRPFEAIVSDNTDFPVKQGANLIAVTYA